MGTLSPARLADKEEEKPGALKLRSESSWCLHFLSILNPFAHVILRTLQEEIRIITVLYKI